RYRISSAAPMIAMPSSRLIRRGAVCSTAGEGTGDSPVLNAESCAATRLLVPDALAGFCTACLFGCCPALAEARATNNTKTTYFAADAATILTSIENGKNSEDYGRTAALLRVSGSGLRVSAAPRFACPWIWNYERVAVFCWNPKPETQRPA